MPKLAILLACALLWTQWLALEHHHESASLSGEPCELCIVAQHGKSGLAHTSSSLPGSDRQDLAANLYRHSLVSRSLPVRFSRGPPVLPFPI